MGETIIVSTRIQKTTLAEIIQFLEKKHVRITSRSDMLREALTLLHTILSSNNLISSITPTEASTYLLEFNQQSASIPSIAEGIKYTTATPSLEVAQIQNRLREMQKAKGEE